jgi:cobalt-zinc-cadmium efflux system membrane fusion protein
VCLVGCGPKEKVNAADAAPPPEKVQEVPDLNLVKVDHPDRYALVEAGKTFDVPQVTATGAVNADIERSIPVISLASGRVVEVDAKLGDFVKKGQLLLKVQSNDIANAIQNYKQAEADEVLARKQLERAKLLYEHGAIALNDLEVAQDVEAKAQVAVQTGAQQVRTLGGDPNQDNSVISIYSPVTGTITEQNVIPSGGVHTPDNQPNLFTISDLTRVWVICDVYENDLPAVRLGDTAEVHLNAYPDLLLHGRISDIGKVLDPAIRTAKVRIELPNPGVMRVGMFVTATFRGLHGHERALVPAGAVLHLHDRDWVFVPEGDRQFRRTEVSVGKIVNAQQEILSGISPAQKVVANALALSAETEQ